MITASTWMAGAILYRFTDHRRRLDVPEEGWPGVTILIPAYNEGPVIANSIRAALASDYPEFEVLVLDDGSSDDTVAQARLAAAGDPRCRVIRDPQNVGKGARLNLGFHEAAYPLVVVTDADSHLHPTALRHLAAVMMSSESLAAVAGMPHVTNRVGMLASLQVIESAAVIDLIRRTQSLTGCVGTVAGVLGMFRKGRVLAVGGYDGRMSTEDIDLTWRLLLAGWQTAVAPRALVGMQVPTRLKPLWSQRKRWSRGQGEVIRVHLRELLRWRNRRMWLLVYESLMSLLWVIAWISALALSVLSVIYHLDLTYFGFGLGWGAAICVIASLQATLAVLLRLHQDRWAARSLVAGAVYPVLYWLISAFGAVRGELPALIRGPRDKHVTWDLARDSVDGADAPGRAVEDTSHHSVDQT